jgi:hypothetical protein
MLLITPPLEFNPCDSSVDTAPTFEEYLSRYEQAVLDQPFAILNRILRFLTRGHRGVPMTSAALEAIVVREWRDDEVEPGQKVARMIVLGAFARSLEDLGIELTPRTVRLLASCERKVPIVLKAAVDDHWVSVHAER